MRLTLNAQADLSLLDHSKVFAIAEKYGADTLKSKAVKNFKKKAKRTPNFRLAGDLNVSALEAFKNAIPHVYSSTLSSVKGLREVVPPIIKEFASELPYEDLEDTTSRFQK
jgi:hypothetical protein